ncbi:hypothetical protein AMTRI_Chr12g275380 [Amborella trichopoda]
MKERRGCELCNGEAEVYCVPDSAFLCFQCDARVHEANFLVARHLRRLVCYRCRGLDENGVSGTCISPLRWLCDPCSNVEGESDPESSESACISSAESFAYAPEKGAGKRISGQKHGRSASSDSDLSVEGCPGPQRPRVSSIKEVKVNIDVKAEAVLINWFRRLGLSSRCTLALALHAFGISMQRIKGFPPRICLAGSLWLAIKLSERKVQRSLWLQKLEACSGVPMKAIAISESKLSNVLKLKAKEEGWAECSET